MRLYRTVGFALFRITAAVIISFIIFIAVSMLHSKFGPGSEEKKGPEAKAVEAEIIRKEPEPGKKSQQKYRQVASASPGQKAASGNRMEMKFAPDLGMDAGPSDGDGVSLQSRELEAEVFDEGRTDEDVVAEYTPAVQYPDRARDQGAEGEFVAIVVIGHNGRVMSIDVTKSPHPSITAEARKVIATWRLKPAKNKGVPVNVRRRVIMDFKLD